MDIMIDLEMMSTRPNAQIVQIGAVMFEPRSGGKILNQHGLNVFVQIQDGGGAIDNSTVAFWLQQPNAKTLGKALETTAVPLDEALRQLTELPFKADLTWEQIGAVWAKPSKCDLPILESAYSLFGLAPPWEHWKSMCAKTLFNLVGGMPFVDTSGLTAHDALDDALVQAMATQKALGMLKP